MPDSTASTRTPGTETAQPDESSTTAWLRGPLELAATAAPLVVTVMAPMTPTADTRASNFVAARSSLTRITRVLLALRPLDGARHKGRPRWFLGNAAAYLLPYAQNRPVGVAIFVELLTALGPSPGQRAPLQHVSQQMD
jgi:hypothetical protein